MKRKLQLTALLLLFAVLWVNAIEVHSYAIDIGEGLPSIDIRTIAQDDKGYLWFGTTNGLLRYNGYTFNTYTVEREPLLYDNHIRDLLYWRDGLVVVRMQGQYCVLFDTDRNGFILFPVAQEQLRAYNRTTVDTHQRLWLFNNSREGVCVNCEGRQFTVTYYNKERPVPEEVWPSMRNAFYDNQGNQIDIVSPGRLIYHDRRTGREHFIRTSDGDQRVTPYVLRYSAVTQGDLVWLSAYGNGVTLYNKVSGETQHIRKGGGLQTDFVLRIYPDRQGNVWALQEYMGVACLSADHRTHKVFDIGTGSHEDPSNFIKALIMLHDGTELVSGNAGDLVHVQTEQGILGRTTMDGDVILAGCEDRDHRLWLGSRTKGVHVNGRWYSTDADNPDALSDNKVNSMVCDHKGRVWLATQHGHLDVAVGNYATGDIRFRHFLPAGEYSTVAVDHRGHLWVGSQSDVYTFDPDELLHAPKAYRKYNTSGSRAGVNDIIHIMEDSRHQVWISTAGKGVFVYDNTRRPQPSTSPDTLFLHLSTADGLVNDMVASTVEDSLGIVWIATQQGLSRYDPATGTIHNVTTDDTPIHNFHTDRAAGRLPDGRLVFGTSAGIAVYTPAPIIHQPTPVVPRHRHLTVTDILINGVNIRQWEDYAHMPALRNDTTITLRHNENSLTFQFSDFNYQPGSKTLYSYRLEGYDYKWSPLSATSQAAYRNLPYGHYRLLVKSTHNDGQVDDAFMLNVTIRPPLWLSWWAWCVYLVLAVIAGYTAYRYLRTVYRLRQSVALEKQMTEFKLRFFTNISHEFRTPLTIIHGSLDRIRHQKQLPGDLKQPLSNIARSENRMMRLINQLLEFRKMENGKLQLALQETDIVIFLHNIFNGFVEVAENKHINFTFHTQVRTLKVFIDRGHVDKIAYNLLSNAFKYTPLGGEVSMRIQVNEALQRFTFSVTDTGVGIPKEKQAELFQRFTQSTYRGDSMGIGLNLTKELVEVHHGNIIFSENQPKGSIFTVDLPRDKSVYSQADFLKENNELIKEQGGEEVNAVAGEYREMAPKPLNDRAIMVVEDDADVLKYIKSLMGQYFNVVTAVDGNDALNQLEAQTVDLIITDVMMPVMNGYELTRKLNADERYQDIPVIMLTAVSDSQYETKGLDVGADAYLTKPFDNDVLVSTCISLIGKRDLLRKRFAAEQREDTSLPKVVKEEADGKFIAVFDTWIEQHLGDTGLSVDDMAAAMQLGRTVFYQKVKALTGMTPNDYLRNHRLDRAASMLKEGHSNVSEVAYKTGFASPHNFTASFKQKFGTTPKKYQMGKVTIQRQVHDEASNLK